MKYLMKPGVAMLPIDSDRIVYLSRQFRYALGKESIEVVCGALEDEAVQMVIDSKITHGPSCVLILKARNVLAQ